MARQGSQNFSGSRGFRWDLFADDGLLSHPAVIPIREAKASAVRIVSLLPSATETLFAIGAGTDVVGVTHECDYPSEALSLPHLTASALESSSSSGEIDRHVRRALHAGSSLYSLDAELLERLAPDLIVTQELCAVCAVSYEIVDRAVRRLKTDPRILSLEPSSLEDVYANIATLGSVTGHSTEATTLIASLRERENRLVRRMRNLQPVRTLLLEWTDPPMGPGHWTPGLIQLAGGLPLLANAKGNAVKLSWDGICAADPDAVIVAPCGYDLEKTRMSIEELNTVADWRGLRAVRNGNVHAIDGNAYVNRPGPRLVESAELIAAALHPAVASVLLE